MIERSEVFAFIESKGADSAIITFEGGNDEGGVQNIELFNGEDKVCELEEPFERYDPEKQTYLLPEPVQENTLIKEMVGPVYGKYHSFAGQFFVEGTLEWDCKEKKVTMSGNEEVPSYDSFEDEV